MRQAVDRLVIAGAFCFKHYPNLPALHSFPTRRSSDLSTSLVIVGALVAPRYSKIIHSQRSSSCHLRMPHFGIGAGDRKSTRLNSSHLGISYAVFCLKKKSGSQVSGGPAVVVVLLLCAA